MGIIKSFTLFILIGITVGGLTITPVKAGQFIVNSDDGSVTAQEKLVKGMQTDLSGGGDATKAYYLDSDQSDDFSWGGYDLLDQPLVDSFRLDNIDESSYEYDKQKLLDEGYVQKFLDEGQGSFDQ